MARWRSRAGPTAVCGWGAAIMAMVAVSVAYAAGAPSCATLDIGASVDPRLCLSSLSSAERAVQAAGRNGFDAWMTIADQRRQGEDFAGTENALACAAAGLEDGVDLPRRYELIRRYGLLAYERDEVPKALDRFECALELAQALDDRAAIAKQLKNAGSARRRLGDYQAALALLLRSLEMMRADGDPATGAVLNNIADVYRDSNQPKQAEEYYRLALEKFRRDGDSIQMMHVYDSLADLALDRDDAKAAVELLEDALEELREEGNRRYRLLIYAGLARAALVQGDASLARRYCADGLALAEQDRLAVPWELHLQTARADRLSGRLEQAKSRLLGAMDDRVYGDHARAAMLEELFEVLKQSGDYRGAVATLREGHEITLRDVRKQSDQQLLWLSERFRAGERERENARLRHQSRQRLLLVWLTVASALVTLLLLLLYFQRRQQRIRLAEATRKARYEEMLAHYRREADTLSEDRKLLQALLDSRAEALCLLDAEGQALAVNRAACTLLAIDPHTFSGRALSDFIAADDAAAFRDALEKMEDAQSLRLPLSSREGGERLLAELSLWEQGGGGLITVGLSPARSEASISAPAPSPAPSPTEGNATREDFRRALVALMAGAVKVWEYATGLNRLELAERSKIWRINIDDGRLRARSMERYLSQTKLPSNPRWRDVLRTAYFVLEQPQVRESERADLQRRVDELLVFMRRRPFV